MHTTGDTAAAVGGLSVTRTPGSAPRLMRNAVRSYDWGSRTALARIQGRDPDGRTEAELWMGAHPLAPSRLRDVDGRETCLAEEIGTDPVRTLGAACVGAFGPRLPFLLKILAIDKALSVQVHPDADRAAAGFAREEADGVPADARRFVDPYPKPELLVAVTHVEVMAGWRPPEQAAALLDLLDGPRAEALRATVVADGVVAALGRLAGWPADDRDALVAEAARAVRVALAGPGVAADPVARTALDRVVQLLDQHPGDPCVLAPLLLDVLVLDPGDGLYVPAGVPHAYLAGLGVEIMSASDNVVRAGLTAKTVDLPLLLELLDGDAAPVVTRPEPLGAHEAAWATPAREFRLSRLAVAGPDPVRPVTPPGGAGPQILLCLTGEVLVTTGTHHVRVRAGESVFVGADGADVVLGGEGEVYRACVGEPGRR